MVGDRNAMMCGKSERGATRMPDDRDNSGSQILERKLATILSADVAAFSRLMGEDEEQTLKIFRGHKKVFESLVAMHRGRIFNTAGDAILAEFGSAVEAVRCATDIQAALRTRNAQLPPSRQVRFRIGINLGDVMVHGHDLLGDGVNVAARLQTAAEPGGICLSGSVHDQIINKLSLSFQSLGEMNFKNIQQPVRTFTISEAEGHGALPVPKPRSAMSSSAKWIAAGLVLLLLLAGGGYWAYTVVERSKAVVAVSPQPVVAAPAAVMPEAKTTEVKPAETKPAKARAAEVKPAATPPEAAPPAVKPAEPKPPEAVTAEAPRQPALNGVTNLTAGAASETSAVSAGPYDGVYSGPICYSKTQKDSENCYSAEGTISGGKINGQWMTGPQKAFTMFLMGSVATSGDIKIEMHSEKPDGTIQSLIDLTGTVHDGLIDASGKFRRGRPATLNWQRNSGASH